MADLEEILGVVEKLYPAEQAPREFLLLQGVAQLRAGAEVPETARHVRTTQSNLRRLAEADDPIATLYGISYHDAATSPLNAKARRGIGQVLLGQVAEKAFELIYKQTLGTDELVLEDAREARNDTDYRVFNGLGRPVFRVNIKFHGTLFRNAQELVGLAPDDCFALATYKIWQGLEKERQENLPYLFMVVSVRDLTGESVGALVPDAVARVATLVRAGKGVAQKRAIEERCVAYLLSPEAPHQISRFIASIVVQVEKVPWRVISATKATLLLREKLFERVFAVRVRGFAQNYRNAELDMHFSLSEDLTPLVEFLRLYKSEGLQSLSTRVARGTI